MSERTAVAIVGAGLTGLVIGHHLARADVDHVVLEAASQPGGVVRSGRVDGHLLEWGPQRTRLTPGVRELVSALGIGDRLITSPPGLPLFVYRAGRLRRVPFSIGAFLRSDIVPFAAKLPLLLEPLKAGARDEETVARYFTRKLGRGLYENLAGPLYGGLYASDPADMIVGLSLRHTLAELRVGRSLTLPLLQRGGAVDPPPACSFRDGMATLTDALHGANEHNVFLDAPVETLRRDGTVWVLETPRGIVHADRVVLTSSAPAAARILLREAPAAAAALSRLRYNPLAIVHLHAEAALRGLGYQVALGERLATRGVTFNDSLFSRTGVYTAFLGGAKAPEVVGWSEVELGAVAVREFRQATGFDAAPIAVERVRMPAWDRSWAALSDVEFPPGLRIAANWESRPGIPGRLAQAKRVAAEVGTSVGG